MKKLLRWATRQPGFSGSLASASVVSISTVIAFSNVPTVAAGDAVAMPHFGYVTSSTPSSTARSSKARLLPARFSGRHWGSAGSAGLAESTESTESAPPRSGTTSATKPSADRKPLWTVRSRYDALIQAVAQRYDVDPALVKAIVQAESAFDPQAVSRAGARGLMQVLPETASRFSIKNLSDPHQNLRAGVMYLRHLLELFDHDVTMAVAAYNAGPNTVRRHRGVPPYNETRRYLVKVLGLRDAYANQSQRS